MQRRGVDAESSVIRFSSPLDALCSSQHAADKSKRSPMQPAHHPCLTRPFPAGLSTISSGLLEDGEV